MFAIFLTKLYGVLIISYKYHCAGPAEYKVNVLQASVLEDPTYFNTYVLDGERERYFIMDNIIRPWLTHRLPS